MKTRILFVCVHNSARSQMAEAFVNRYCSECFEAESAGLEPGTLNPIVVEAMKEVGIDISHHRSKSLNEFLPQRVETVITVCGNADQACPIFPGQVNRHHWPFFDPAKATGNV